MANNYIQFSEEIKELTKEEAEWLELMSNLASDRDVDLKENDDRQHFSDEGEALTEEAKLAKVLFSDEPHIDVEIEEDPGRGWKAWFYSDEGNDPMAVATLVQAFFKKFRAGKKEVFSLAWADYCSKLRVGEFGGGVLVVNEEQILITSTPELVRDLEDELKDGKQVAVLVYHHRHGENIDVYATAALATRSACTIIKDYILEIEDKDARAKMEAFLENGDWYKALDEWFEYQNELPFTSESIEIFMKKVR
jgi:hypothetical protein